jgi:glycosyltransferase involved in cell wall biosynthesis
MKQGKSILIDSRWDGETGIGRMYREIMARKPAEVNVSEVQSNMALGHLLSPVMLAKEIRNSTAELFYSPSFMPPLYAKIPFVFTIHDLMHLFYYSPLHAVYYKQVIARCAAKAKKLITVSEFSKNQLIEHLGLKEDLISVIYNGISPSFLSNTEASITERPYFLYVGNRRKNKNVPTMIKAFAAAKIPQDFVFALSGYPDPELMALIKKLDVEKRVQFLGFIPEEALPKCYKGAFATMFVSLMEGFGLPVLESMASGTPVLTSSASSLPEIAGNAALCVDPMDVDAISSGIEKLVNDKEYYRQCVDRGKLRAAEFSWDDTARQTWDLLLDR